jgi:putative CocE/NonD family hydrolase
MKRVIRIALKIVVGLLLVVLILGGLAYWQRTALVRAWTGIPPYRAGLGERLDLEVPMRDGVKLKTQAYLPSGAGPWPALLLRGPYGEYAITRLVFEVMSRYGFAVVHQDVRGKNGSGGEFVPFVHEREDGIDTLRWLVTQPWVDGNVATYGESYLGLTQWAVLDAMPPEVKTAVIVDAHGDVYESVWHRGLLHHGFATVGALVLGGRFEGFLELARARPLLPAAQAALSGAAQYRDFLASPEREAPYWRQEPLRAMRDSARGARIPVLSIGRWHDIFLDGQLRSFEGLPTRDRSLMVVEQGSHADDQALPVLDWKAGLRESTRLQLAWLNHWLRGEPLGVPASGYRIQSFDGRWENLPSWPPAASALTLRLGRVDASRRCDGGLLSAETGPPASITYRHDPDRPVPTRGGESVFALVSPTGVAEQGNDLCGRDDVLSFASDPLPAGLHVAGSIGIVLAVSSTAPDTAFAVKVQEHRADGKVLILRDDIASLSRRSGSDDSEPYTPGERVPIQFTMVPLDWNFAAGSRLRLDVSSSSWPAYHSHPNVAEPLLVVSRAEVADQTLYGGEITLPLVQPPGE